MFEISWNITSKIKYKRLERIVQMLIARFPGEKRMALGGRFITNFSKSVNERARTLSEKDLNVVGDESKEET